MLSGFSNCERNMYIVKKGSQHATNTPIIMAKVFVMRASDDDDDDDEDEGVLVEAPVLLVNALLLFKAAPPLKPEILVALFRLDCGCF